MGLTLRVGPVEFASPYQEQVEAALLKKFAYIAPGRDVALEESEELAWSGWAALQDTVTEAIGAENAPNLLSMEAWIGVYLPLPIEPRALQVGDSGTPLECASLPALSEELHRFAAARSLPTEEEGLTALWDDYMERIDSMEIDESEGDDIQTYIQLMLSVNRALSRNLPLWVVK